MRNLIRGLPRLDGAGLALIGVWIIWAATSSLLQGGFLSPLSPYVVAPVIVALGVALGRKLADRARGDWAPKGWIEAGALALTSVFFIWELVAGGAGGGPLGYANANAALAVQVSALVALATLAAGRDSPHGRRFLLLALLAGVLTTVTIGSRAGTALALTVMAAIALALSVRLRHRWWVLAIGATSVVGASITIWRLAGQTRWPGWAAIAFDEARQELWADALMLWQLNPVLGAGPGAFREFTPLAVDTDTDTAHSSVLQVAAETGVVGVVLFAALAAMGFALAAQSTARATLIGVAAWSALVIHSFVDHLLEFWPVVLAAGLVLGWAGSRSSEKLDVGEGEGPIAG